MKIANFKRYYYFKMLVFLSLNEKSERGHRHEDRGCAEAEVGEECQEAVERTTLAVFEKISSGE